MTVWASRTLLLALASMLFLSCPSTSETPLADRYAKRFLPPSDGWTRESSVEPRKQGIWEVSNFAPDTEPTRAQQQAADQLVKRSWEAATRHGWFGYEKGLAGGWVQNPGDPHHYRNPTYLLDGVVLDPERPEFLMYYPYEGKPVLTGLMFLANDRSERGEQIGGPLTIWHYHTWRRPQCAVDHLIPTGWGSPKGGCEKGEPFYRSPEMIHVWLIDRPGGVFSSGMVIPPADLKAAVAKRMKENGF